MRIILNLFLLSVSFALFPNAGAQAEEKNYAPDSANKVRLTWEEVKGVTSYRIIIKNTAGKEVLREDSGVNSIVVDIAPGDYKLRIGSINKFNKIWSWSDWADLAIEKTALSAYETGSPESKQPPQDGKEVKASKDRKDLQQASETAGEDAKQETKVGKGTGTEAAKETAGKTSSGPGISISVEGNYILPMGIFKDIIENGMGGLLFVERPNLFFSNFTAGIVSGYWQFTGEADINKSYIIPALVTAGYNINFLLFSLTPRVSAGMSYNYIDYSYVSLGEEVVKSISSIEPIAMAGLRLYLNLGAFSFYFGGDYGSIIESENRFPFTVFGAGLSFRF